MPKYYNVNNANAVADGVLIGPKETVETTVYLQDLPAGVTLVDANPIYNPIMYSNKFTADQVVSVPAGAKSYFVEFFTEAGEWEIKFNSASATPPLELPEGATWSKRVRARVIDTIYIVRKTSSGRIWVQMENI